MCATLMIDEMSDADLHHWVYGLRWSLMLALKVHTTESMFYDDRNVRDKGSYQWIIL
jgi:hypothetical protein